MKQLLLQRWRALSQRERIAVGAGAAVLGVSLLFVLVLDPLLTRQDLLDRQAVRKERELREVAALGAEYSALQARLSQLERRMPPADVQFSLLAFLEEAATNSRVRERIAGMQPQNPTVVQGYQETAVDLRLDGVPLPDLLALLVALEQAPYDIQVRHLQIKPKFDTPHSLEANLRVIAYAKSR